MLQIKVAPLFFSQNESNIVQRSTRWRFLNLFQEKDLLISKTYLLSNESDYWDWLILFIYTALFNFKRLDAWLNQFHLTCNG